MNSCCVNPVEVIAEDKHKPAEQCCLVTDITLAPAQAECPVSRTLSRKVQKRTVEHLLKPEKVSSIQSVQYYYCTDPNCNVVYFSNESAPFFIVDDVRVKVLSKDKGDDVDVCYCFNWTRAHIKGQLGGIERMLDDDRPVKEAYAQLKAAEKALHQAIYGVLDNQLKKHFAEILAERLALCPGDCDDAERLQFLKSEFAKLDLKVLIDELAWLRNSLILIPEARSALRPDEKTSGLNFLLSLGLRNGLRDLKMKQSKGGDEVSGCLRS